MSQEGYQIIPSLIGENPNTQITRLVYLTDKFDLKPNESTSFKLMLYDGPKKYPLCTRQTMAFLPQSITAGLPSWRNRYWWCQVVLLLHP